MNFCFIVSLMASLSLSHSSPVQTVITVDGKEGDAICSKSLHCKTLDAALSVIKDNKAIVTVKILNGTYYHNTTPNSTIIRSGITIFGNGSNTTIVECNDGAGFGFINASNINISELTLSGCGELRNSTTMNATIPFRVALYFLNVVNVTIDSVAVINSNGMGVAMYNVTGNVTVRNSIFRNNSVSSHEPGGGGFTIDFACKPEMGDTSECETITNNINSLYSFYNCTFKSNMATIVDTTHTYSFSNQQFGRGGGLSVFFRGKAFNNTVNINTSKFIDNRAIWGGGFHSDITDHSRNNTVNIINSIFDHNQCTLNITKGLFSVNTEGGAIRIALLSASIQYNFITIKQCNFSYNSAYYGGGVSYLITKEADRTYASNTVNFLWCRWFNNTAQTGSAVNLETQPFPFGVTPNATFSDCSFLSNTNEYTDSSNKPVGIGALYSDNIPVVFTGNCSFSSNKGTAVTGSATFFILANNSVTKFDGNVGNNGGAIALLGNTYIILDHYATVWFTENKAHSKGGAIYFVSSSERDYVNTRKCFIFYANKGAGQGQWNVSVRVHFQNNNDLCNKSIYATTLLPCVWEISPDNDKPTLDSVFKQTFRFVDSSGPTISNNSMTDAVNITVNEPTPVQLPPGRLYKLKITSLDELNNEVNPVFLVQTLNPKISSVDSTTDYIYDNKIRLYGRQGSRITLQLETLSSRPRFIMIDVNLIKCPPGFYSDANHNNCTCARNNYYGIYRCSNIRLIAYLYLYIWAGIINKTGNRTFVTADCPQGYCNTSVLSPPLPANFSVEANTEFELKECVFRNGTLCGRCITGYCVATNSPTYRCINFTSTPYNKHGIFWLIILKYIPFTIFLLLIVFFNVSLVDGPLNSFILFAQIINSLGPVSNAIIHLNEKDESKGERYFSYLYYFLYGPWNLNYFEMVVSDFCAYKFDSTIKVLMFEYIPALFPLVLFVLFYSIIPCITNCLVNSQADMPRRCLLKVERMFIIFRRTWSIRRSIIHGLTTFLVLSYAKVTTVTGLLLASTTLYGNSTEGEVKTVVRFDGSMDFLKGEHIPYACVAFILLFTVVLLPPLFLLSYPLLPNLVSRCNLQDKWFFKTFIIKPLDKCVPFFDAFQSCFKNRYRFFAGLYFLYRAIVVAILTFQWKLTSRLMFLQGFFLIAVLIHCTCQPYKSRKYNILDGAIFILLLAINSLSLYNVFYNEIYLNTLSVSFWIQLILIYTPFVFFIVFFCYYVSKRCAPCINKVKQTVSKIQTFTPNNNNDEVHVPARLLETSSSSSSSSSEEEDDPDDEQDVEMILPVQHTGQPSAASVAQSPYQASVQNRRNRFTT